MKGLIINISVALVIGRVHSQSSSALSPTNQQSPGYSTPNGVVTPGAMNTTKAANSTLSTETAGALNSASALNATATPMSSSVATDGTSLTETSLSPNSTVSSIFVMDQQISWSNSNFSIFDQNGTLAYQITNQYAGANLTAEEFIVQDAISGEKRLKVNSRVKACGFGQTYEADDGTTFVLDTRAFLSDRWYIKDANSEYTFKRHALSLQGKILENERLVAQVTTAQANSTSTFSSQKKLTVTSDGSIRPWDLIALMAVAETRIRTCGY